MLTVASLYALAVAVLVLALWIGSLVRGAVPELATQPKAIRFHIAAEVGMAALLAAGGVLGLAGAPGAEGILLLGFGAVLYSVVNSSGHYAELGQGGPLVLFGVLLMVTTGLAAGLLAG